MSGKNSKTVGGLVLKKAELDAILAEPDTNGLAFGVEKPGAAEHVGLIVFKVSEGESGLEGEERIMQYQMGAQTYDGFPAEKEKFQFEHLEELMNTEFDFSYLERDEFEHLFRDGGDEVFIAGSVRDYGSTGAIRGKYFTLIISPRFDPGLEAVGREFGNPPTPQFTEGCPPIWKRAEETTANESLVFHSSNE